jgi:hypothetical protein
MFFPQVLPAIAVAIACLAQPPIDGEKAARTPAQQKINSQILFEIYRARGEAERKGVPPGDTGVRIDARGRALVDVRAPVSAALNRTIRRLGGVVVSSSPAHLSTIARIPLLKLESLAADPSVKFIEPMAEATTVREPISRHR